MQRIIILGSPGSGKSTLGRKLAQKLDLPLYHLDNIYWRSDGTIISRPQFDQKLQEILDTDSWIIDGDYSRTYRQRFERCDTVIMLDYGMEVCMQGIKARIGKEREDMPYTFDYLDPQLVEEVEQYKEVKRPRVIALMDEFNEIRKLIFTSREECESWVDSL